MGRNTSIIVGTVLLCSTGCKRAPEAPRELSELAGYLFEHMMDEDTAEVEAGVTNLHLWLQDHSAETLEGYKVTNLKQSVIDSVDPDREHDLSNLAGASVGAVIEHEMLEVTEALVLHEQEEVFPEQIVVHDRTFVTDESCFLPAACDSVTTDNYVESDFGVITTTTQSRTQYRWVEFEEGTALMQRAWLTDEADVGGAFGGVINVKEQLYVGVIFDWGEGRVWRLGTTWVAAEVAGQDFEEMAVNNMINAMGNEAALLDEYLD
jgi:hypothetical protein